MSMLAWVLDDIDEEGEGVPSNLTKVALLWLGIDDDEGWHRIHDCPVLAAQRRRFIVPTAEGLAARVAA